MQHHKQPVTVCSLANYFFTVLVNILSYKNSWTCSLRKKCLVCIPHKNKSFAWLPVSQNISFVVREILKNLLSRTFLYAFRTELFLRKKLQNSINKLLYKCLLKRLEINFRFYQKKTTYNFLLKNEKYMI